MRAVVQNRLRAGTTAAALGFALGGCGDDGVNTVPIDTPSSASASASVGSDVTGSGDTHDASTGSTQTGSDTTTGGETTSGSDDADTSSSGDETGAVDACTNDCGLNGYCVDGQCQCTTGFVFDAMQATCVVDESCIELTMLEARCRQRVDGFPAAAMFFGVDFCSGDAVVPAKLTALGLEFQVLENGVDIAQNVESSAVVLAKDVESYVVIAVDVSTSVQQSQDLPALFDELRGLVAGLAPQSGEPPVSVAIVLFGRTVKRHVDFTTDLVAVDAALQALVVQLQAGENPINPMGTSLFEAVRAGVKALDDIRAFRGAVTAGGRLTTGTLVVVTDGKDTSGGEKDIPESTNQIVAIGVSPDVDADELQTIGEHGTFFAPTAQTWPAAFAAITTRVDEYPERSYLLGYCSSATQGSPTVEVTLVHPQDRQYPPPKLTATCSFDADKFAADPPLCNAAELVNECASFSCGGLTACGACADDACCNELSGTCQTPQSMSPCAQSDALCAPTQEICVEDVCVAPANEGEACLPRCAPGVTWCSEELCIATLSEGMSCQSATECATLHCGPDPKDLFAPPICLPPLELNDPCEESSACPLGTYCDSTCTLRKGIAEPCEDASQCLSAHCELSPSFGEDGKVCLDSGVCQVTWSDVL